MKFILPMLVLGAFLSMPSAAQTISGVICSEDSIPLAGVNIYIEGRGTGVSSNQDGKFRLVLPDTSLPVIISHIGYSSDTLLYPANKGEYFSDTLFLTPSALNLSEVTVYSGEYNRAELILLECINRKTAFQNSLNNYTVTSHNKSVFEAVNSKGDTVIGGITEAFSKAFYQVPDNFQEIVLMKRQTGNFASVQNIFTAGKPLCVLEDYVTIDELRIISPLHPDAIDYYSFSLADTLSMNSNAAFRISFEPKSTSLPLFEGTIIIVDGIFMPESVILRGGESVITSMKRDVTIMQRMRKVNDSLYLPAVNTVESIIDIGLPLLPAVYLTQTNTYTDYQVNDPEFSHTFDERALVTSGSFDGLPVDTLLGSQFTPLSEKEEEAYRRIDSIMQESGFLLELIAFAPAVYADITDLPFGELTDFYHANRIEGNYVGAGVKTKDYFDSFLFQGKIGYGFNDERTKWSAKLSLGEKPFKLSFFGSDDIAFYDPAYQYSLLSLTYATLVWKGDYADYYYRKSIGVEARYSFNRDFSTTLLLMREEAISANRQKLFDWSLLDSGEGLREPVPVAESEYTVTGINIGWNNLRILDYGFATEPDYSQEFTDLLFSYRFGKTLDETSAPDYHELRLRFYQLKIIPPFFRLHIAANAGLIDTREVPQRLMHLPGTYGVLTAPYLFRTIKEDSYAGRTMFTFHIHNNFKNTLFNIFGIPFLENTRYDLWVFTNIGWLDNGGIELPNFSTADYWNRPLIESGFGIGNILMFLRFDFSWRITHTEENPFGFSISSNLSL